MPSMSLVRPIENIATKEETHVLAVLDHLMPVLDEWRQGKALIDEEATLKAELLEKEPSLSTLRMQVSDLDGQRELLRGRVKTAQIMLIIAVILTIGLAMMMGVMPAILAAVLAVGFLFRLTSQSSKKKAVMQELSERELEAAELSTLIDGLKHRCEEIAADLERRGDGFPEIRLAQLQYGIEVAEVDGRKMMLDASGTHPRRNFKVVDVSALQRTLTPISDRVGQLLQVPPMLSPGRSKSSTDENAAERLYGEEGELSELVTEYTQSLGLVRDVTLSLPIVSPKSVLAQRCVDGALRPLMNVKPINVVRSTINPARIREFFNAVDQTRRSGEAVFAELREVFQNLEQACNRYAGARAQSINTLHTNLLDVLQRATWCSRRFYCARTIMAPSYLEELLGVPVTRAYLLSFDDLMTRLRADETIDRRLNLRKELETQLHDAYMGVQEFMGSLSFDANGNRLDEGQRPRHFEDQFQESARSFGHVLQKVMTGSYFPMVNVSAEAVLHYDPDSDEWSSPITPHVYSTPDTLRYGGVLKAYSDLMIPLWEHLWTEKADFRKSETFRTNEQMIRMAEKEAEKLIDIANQFRADMRSVREHVNIIEADLQSKTDEIIAFRDGMDSLGILTDRTRAALANENLLTKEAGPGMAAESDRYETVLSALPQTQMENRGTVQDPIELIRGPDVLLTISNQRSTRMLTNAGDAV